MQNQIEEQSDETSNQDRDSSSQGGHSSQNKISELSLGNFMTKEKKLSSRLTNWNRHSSTINDINSNDSENRKNSRKNYHGRKRSQKSKLS